MNFFERQQAARGTTVKLVLLFTAAVISLVAVIDGITALAMTSKRADTSSVIGVVIAVTAITLLIIIGGMAGKTISLRQGGSAVAASVGAVPVDPSTSDPQLRRFINIVEEMSIASGVPVPRLFVMTNEPAINAFAAGFTPADAAITVTAGALSQLNRDELQGVIGHEFSHILNGDMRLNIRLIGLLSGILLIGLIGLRVLQFGGGRGSDRRNGAPILVIALAMLVIGFVGSFFASVIKAAVSRQREWLADASAVQFTRQTTGLEGALKKIAGLKDGTALRDSRSAAEVSHMLFGEGGRSFAQLFATHPPLFDRIKALDPSFTTQQFEQINASAHPASEQLDDLEAAAGFAAPPARPPAVLVQPSEVALRAGTLTPRDVERGAQLSAQIPPRFRQLATQGTTTVPLVLGMLLAAEPAMRQRQLDIVGQRLGPQTQRTTTIVGDQLGTLPELLYLPVLASALPVVTTRPSDEVRAVLATVNDLALADGVISVFEYCLTRLLWSYLQDVADPSRRSRIGTSTLAAAQSQATLVLSALAAASGTGSGAPVPSWQQLDAAWPVLDALAPAEKQRFVEQMVQAVLSDGKLEIGEAELLRAACAVIHVPLPPLVA